MIASSLLLADFTEQEAAVERGYAQLLKKFDLARSELQKQVLSGDAAVEAFQATPRSTTSSLRLEDITSRDGLGDGRLHSEPFHFSWGEVIAHRDALRVHERTLNGGSLRKKLKSRDLALEGESVDLHGFPCLQRFVSLHDAALDLFANFSATRPSEADVTALLDATTEQLRLMQQAVVCASPAANSADEDRVKKLTELCDLRFERIAAVNESSGATALATVKDLRKHLVHEVEGAEETCKLLLESLPRDVSAAKSLQQRAEKERIDASNAFVAKSEALRAELARNGDATTNEWKAVEAHLAHLVRLGEERRKLLHAIVHEKQCFDEDVTYFTACEQLCEQFASTALQVEQSAKEEQSVLREFVLLGDELLRDVETLTSAHIAKFDGVLLPEQTGLYDDYSELGRVLVQRIVEVETSIRAISTQLDGIATAQKSLAKVNACIPSSVLSFYAAQRLELEAQLSSQVSVLAAAKADFATAIAIYAPVEADMFVRFPEERLARRPLVDMLNDYRTELRNRALEVEEADLKLEVSKLQQARAEKGNNVADETPPPPNIDELNSPARLRDSYAERIRKQVASSSPSSPAAVTAVSPV